MTAPWLWLILLLALLLTIGLRPGATWLAVAVAALLLGDQLHLVPAVAVCAVVGLWLVYSCSKLFRRVAR